MRVTQRADQERATEETARRQERLEWRRRRLASPRGKMRVAFWLTVMSVLMCLTAVVMMVVAFVTFFRARRFYAEVLAKWLSRGILMAAGVNVIVHRKGPYPVTQTIYLANHTSTLDIFILLSLGLPRTRYFMRGKFRKIIPLGIISHLIGAFFTPSQTKPGARVRCFQNADRVLRRTGDSVYLSPEGRRILDGKIGPFNKGSFHLATSLQVPIVPLYIDIPVEINPGMGYGVIPGTVHFYVLPEISTEGWELVDLLKNKEAVRDVYVRFLANLRAKGPEPLPYGDGHEK